MERDFNVGTQMMRAVASLGGEPPSRRPRCASPVVTDWFLAWADALGKDAGRQLAPYVEPVARSRGSADDEAARQWLVAEWLLGTTLPTCLDAAGATNVARDLADSSAVRSARDLAALASFVDEAARAARHTHDGWRQATAALRGGGLHPTVNRPPWRATGIDIGYSGSSAWRALGDGVRAAVEPVRGLFAPSEAVLGIGTHGGSYVPTAIGAAPAAVTDCLLAVAWSGCYRRLTTGNWRWDAPPHEAEEVGSSAAVRALGPLHVALGRQAHDLVRRMLTIDTGRHSGSQPPADHPIAGAWAS